MKINEYQELAMTTLNPELSKRDVLINSVMGLCGESGEAIDIVKKWMAQGHELDKEHLAKELGDVACICKNSVYNEPNLLLEVDHIIPISKGGMTEENNLQTLCWKCNRAKADKIIIDC